MSTYQGVEIVSGCLAGGVSPYLVPAFGTGFEPEIWPYSVPAIEYVANRQEAVAGVRTVRADPLAYLDRTLQATSTVKAYLYDFYFRFHLSPNSFDLGNVTSDSELNFFVWNAYFVDKDLSALTATSLEGVSLAGQGDPYTFPPLSLQNYTVTVTTTGAALIDGYYTFTLGGVEYVVDLSGIRVLFFPFDANWSSPVAETLTWSTTLLRSYNGRVQAAGPSAKPRRGFSYSIAEWKHHPQLLDNLVFASQWRNIVVRVDSDLAYTAGATAIGSQVVAITGDTYLNFYDGMLVVFYQDNDTYEVIEVATYVAGQLTLARGLVNNWPENTEVYPCYRGHLPAAFNTRRHSDIPVEAAVSFACDPVTTDPNLPVAAAPLSFNGFELYLNEPNRVPENPLDFINDFDLVDGTIGATQYDDRSTFSDTRRGFDWLFAGRAEINDFRAFLARRDGARNPVYMPTWQQDFTLVGDAQATDTTLVVNSRNLYANIIGSHLARQHLIVRFKDGTWLTATISGSTNNGDGTTDLEVGTIGQAIAADQVLAIHYLLPWRMNNAVTLQWHTSRVLTASVSFTSEPNP